MGRKGKERDGERRGGRKSEGEGWGEKGGRKSEGEGWGRKGKERDWERGGGGKIQFQSKINKKQNKKKQQPTSTWDECLIKEESWLQDQMN